MTPINESISDRGFIHLDPVKTTYGADVRISESSAAMAPHIWLRINGEAHLRGPVKPFVGIPDGIAQADLSAHMTLAQAEQIYAQLGHMIERTKQRWGIEP